MNETPAAKQAFEDLWLLGDDRSISKLAAEYRRRSDGGEGVPTTRERTLEEWSAQHGWQKRIEQRIDEEAKRVQKKMQAEADKTREMLTTAISTDFKRLIKELAEDGRKRLSENAADLERLAKLYFQLTGQPLAERTELSGPGGGPVEVHWIEKLREVCGEEDEDGEG